MKRLADRSRLLRAAAVEMRLCILRRIAGRPLRVAAPAAQFGIPQSAVSQHVRILRDAGPVRAARRGMFVHDEAEPGDPLV